jgi:hypothetical protein
LQAGGQRGLFGLRRTALAHGCECVYCRCGYALAWTGGGAFEGFGRRNGGKRGLMRTLSVFYGIFL